METPEPATTRSARQFVLMGVQLQEALKTGMALDPSLDAFCREAFARKDLAQSISFLLTLVQKDVGRLAEILKVRHLVAELSVGSQILSSLVAAQWDKKDEAEKLAELADGILSAHMSGVNLSSASEFAAALAKTIAVLHPARARALLDMAGPLMPRNSESESMLKEAWDWQKAGELLAGKDMEFRRFWHQTLRQQRGDWFWDTAEGRKALAGLDSGTEDLNVRGGLFRRAVPAWAWKPGEQSPAPAAAEVRERAAPAPTLPGKTAAPPSIAEESRRTEKSSWFTVAGIGLLACVAVLGASQVDFSQLLSGSAPTSVATAAAPNQSSLPASTPTVPRNEQPAQIAVIPPPTLVAAAPGTQPPAPAKQPDLAAKVSAEPPPATPPSAVASTATLPPALSEQEPAKPMPALASIGAPQVSTEVASPPPAPGQTGPKPVLSAQMVPVSLTSRQGWVKTPLGSEFKVTTSNASEGKITDDEGRVWRLPENPKPVAQVISAGKATNPYSGEVVTVSSDQWKPGQELPFGTTGWTYTLPATLPAGQNAMAPANALALLAPEPSLPPAPGQPATAEAPAAAENVPGSGAKPAEEAKKTSGQPAKMVAAKTTAGKTKAKSSSPKSTSKMVTARRPTGEAQRKEADSVAHARTQQELVFVTRANSIRMNYKGGYWESRPGAYLAGEGNSPAEWARDMTLRERTSGTIPDGYMFKVLDRGVVRVQPEPPGR